MATLSVLRKNVKDITRDYGQRTWSDSLIDARINEGYSEFSRMTHVLRKTGKITIVPNIPTYSLPSDTLQVNRFEWNDIPIPVSSEMEMDDLFGIGWRTATGGGFKTVTGSSIQRIMQDNQGEGTIRIYPRIANSDNIGTLVEVVGTDGNDYFCVKNHTSATADKPVTGTNYSLYWTATGGSGAGAVWAAGTDYTKYLYLYIDYVYLPTDLSDDADEPAIESRFHFSLAEYAVYKSQYDEAQSDGHPVMAQVHYDNFLFMVGVAKERAIRGFASYQRNRRAQFPRFV